MGKIKIKGLIENKQENTKEKFETKGIKRENIISFISNDIKYKMDINPTKITLLRENDIFSHKLTFIKNKETDSEYYIKEYDTTLIIPMITKKIDYDDNKIKIIYLIKETMNEHVFILEMSEK